VNAGLQISSKWPASSRNPSPNTQRTTTTAWEAPAEAAAAAPAPAAPAPAAAATSTFAAPRPPAAAPAAAPAVKAAFDMHAEGGMVGRLAMLCTLGQLGSLEKLDHRRAAQV